LVDRWSAFGWKTFEMDGHDIGEILETVMAARDHKGSPAVIVAHTVKGKGVSYMENDFTWHSRVPTDEELATALAELGERDREGRGG
jgi:transketolase